VSPPYVVRVANLSVLNQHAVRDAVTLVEGRPHLVAACEARRTWEDVLPTVPGYRWLGRRSGRHGSREVGLLVRDDVEVVAHGVEQLSHEVPRSAVAHDRWGAWARVVLPGGVRALAWSTHRNAFVQRADGGVRRWWRGTAEYRRHARHEVEVVLEHAADGWPLLGGGDYNYRVPRGAVTTVHDAWRWAPHRTFPDAGLAYAGHWFDGACWHPGAFAMVGGLDVIGRARTGSDHDWLTAAFEPVAHQGG
jgi:hypothetical protein